MKLIINNQNNCGRLHESLDQSRKSLTGFIVEDSTRDPSQDSSVVKEIGKVGRLLTIYLDWDAFKFWRCFKWKKYLPANRLSYKTYEGDETKNWRINVQSWLRDLKDMMSILFQIKYSSCFHYSELKQTLPTKDVLHDDESANKNYSCLVFQSSCCTLVKCKKNYIMSNTFERQWKSNATLLTSQVRVQKIGSQGKNSNTRKNGKLHQKMGF